MKTKLKQIRSAAQADPETVFTSVFHLVADVEHLRECYRRLNGRKAIGVDGQTKQEYGENLDENLKDLCARLHRGGYRPKPAKRTWIEKPGSDKQRPLAISCFEDKLVQLALRDLLGAIYEPLFLKESFGYREGKNAHQCIDLIGRCVQKKQINCVLEADIRAFFDRMNHDWLIKFVKHRVKDSRVTRLLIRMLRSGIMDEGLCLPNVEGAPQGSILSPLLSNLYLHFVLDLWFTRSMNKKLRSEAYLFRFADDFVICFQCWADAGKVQEELKDRLRQFNLELAEEKTGLVGYGRYEQGNARKVKRKVGSFEFLGFRFVCGKTRSGYFKVKRMTSGKRLSRSLKRSKAWLDANYARLRKGDLIRGLSRMVTGHLEYFAITDNLGACQKYMFLVRRQLFRALNRKSQRGAYTWVGFMERLKHAKWPKVHLRHSIDPCRKVIVQSTFKDMG